MWPRYPTEVARRGMSALDSGDHASGDSSPLPVGWRKVHSRTKGRDYFVNESTGRSQWHPPDSLGQSTTRGKALEPGPDGIVQHLRPRHSDTSGEEGPHADAATARGADSGPRHKYSGSKNHLIAKPDF